LCVITISGMPGSGKSTQVAILADRLGPRAVVLSVPRLLRTHTLDEYLTRRELDILENHKPAASASRTRGTLAPLPIDEILFHLAGRLARSGMFVILDGAPRGLAQAELMLNLVESGAIPSYCVIYLRLPKPAGLVSLCRQIQRSVRTKGAMSTLRDLRRFWTKIAVFRGDTARGLSYLRRNGVLIEEIPARLSRDEVSEAIWRFVSTHRPELHNFPRHDHAHGGDGHGREEVLTSLPGESLPR